MRTMLELESETAEKIRQMADARQLSVDEFLAAYVHGLASDQSTKNGTEAQDKLRAFEEWIASFSTDTPPLSDQAISRDSIYRDR
jgi:hypothetical protein